jgi:hypothetical protein
MTAYHETQGCANDQHEKSIKIFGNEIQDAHYPDAISFYAKGMHEEFEFCGIDSFTGFDTDFTGLATITTIEEANIQIAKFLKTTREKNAKNKRKRLEKNNDRKFHTQNGTFTKSFRKTHWDIIYRTIPITSILNIMYRLRIKANYQNIKTFIDANIDFKEFNNSITYIVKYINFVHEAYIAKAIGKKAYEKIVYEFPERLNEKTSLKRYNKIISKIR